MACPAGSAQGHRGWMAGDAAAAWGKLISAPKHLVPESSGGLSGVILFDFTCHTLQNAWLILVHKVRGGLGRISIASTIVSQVKLSIVGPKLSQPAP